MHHPVTLHTPYDSLGQYLVYLNLTQCLPESTLAVHSSSLLEQPTAVLSLAYTSLLQRVYPRSENGFRNSLSDHYFLLSVLDLSLSLSHSLEIE